MPPDDDGHWSRMNKHSKFFRNAEFRANESGKEFALAKSKVEVIRCKLEELQKWVSSEKARWSGPTRGQVEEVGGILSAPTHVPTPDVGADKVIASPARSPAMNDLEDSPEREQLHSQVVWMTN
mmetsp:Transcript_85163/g.149036  ORF Transcript_85163/g.149036 Transcript_85163/m.149036 type:complete len:124 (-) Transcript_85163:416-787(-)